MAYMECYNPYNLNIRLTIQIIDYFPERTNFINSYPNVMGQTFVGAINYDTDCRVKNGNNPNFVGLLTSFGNVDNETTIPAFLNYTPPNVTDTEMYFQTIQTNAFSEVILRVYFCKYYYVLDVNNNISNLNIYVKRYLFVIKPNQDCIYQKNSIPVALNQANITQALFITYPDTLLPFNIKIYNFEYGLNQVVLDGLTGTATDAIIVKNYVMSFVNSLN
jgi:hypothetical protein